MELVDTHCHLTFDPLRGNLEDVLSRAAARGVRRIVVPAYDLESHDAVESIRSDVVRPAMGLHPWVAHQTIDTIDLENRLHRSEAVAVGEIGLDFKIDSPNKARQIDIFERQLDVAARARLPVLLHCRGAHNELIETVRGFTPNIRGVIHAFSRGPELLERFLELDLFVAFGGAVTRPRAKQARRSAALVPMDRLLIETDAPSIGLDGVDPSDVEPHHVADVAAVLSTLRGTTIENIADITTDNANKLFGF